MSKMAQTNMVKYKILSNANQIQRQSFDAGAMYISEDGGLCFDHPNGTRISLNTAPVSIHSGDLNDFQVNGTYIVESNAVAHIPTNVTSGLLKVYSGKFSIYQEFISSTGSVSYRNYTKSNSTWTSWVTHTA